MPRDLCGRRLFIAPYHMADGIDRLSRFSVVQDAERSRTCRAAEIRDRPCRDRFLKLGLTMCGGPGCEKASILHIT